MSRRYTGADVATAGNLADIIGKSHLVTAIVGDLAATVEALEAELLTVTAQRDSSFGYVESIETALNEAGVDDVVTEWSGHPEDPPYGRQADPLERVVMLAQSRDGWRLRVESLEAERDALRRIVALERGDESAAIIGWHWNPHALYWWSDHGWGIWRANTSSWNAWLGRIKRDYDDCPIDMRESKGFHTIWDAMSAAPPALVTGARVTP